VQASVARCLRTPPQPAKAKGFDFGLSRCIKQRERPEHSCHWQLLNGPLRRYHHGQKLILYALVDPISPPAQAAAMTCGLWWRRRVPPPGPMGLLRWPFIAIATLAGGSCQYRRLREGRKGQAFPKAPAIFPQNSYEWGSTAELPQRCGTIRSRGHKAIDWRGE
jgi:hypothetical protein